MTDHIWTTYRRRGVTEMRPYQPGEDLTGISVQANQTPQAGGWIARNPQDRSDQWYVTPEYFAANMEKVEDDA